MKNIFCYLLMLSIAGIILIVSCKKEYSCEGCREGNKPPIANAGSDQVITLPTDSISLDGSASNDPDGTISGWLWKNISGPASFSFISSSSVKTIVRNLVAGIYQFELNITDNKGLSAKDTLQVIVNDPTQPNRPPVANAGPDQIITLPTNTVTVNGTASTDPDNNIINYLWTKISGPSFFTINNASGVQTQVTNLILGTYQFELIVTDATGLFDKDTAQVTVMNSPPPCNNCKVAFVSDRDGNQEIYSCNSDGSNIVRLTNNPGSDDEPSWSPDRTRIAFISNRAGSTELYLMNADGSNVVRKTFFGTYAASPTWSPDGTKIAYTLGGTNISVIDMASGISSLLFDTPGIDVYPAWSPNGMTIALVSDWAAYDFVSDIYTINADGSGFTALTGNIFDHIDYMNPSWSPAGTKLAITMVDAVSNNQFNSTIGVMNPDGSGITTVITAAAWSRTSWSPDGTMIAYTSLAGSRKDVSWLSVNGSSSGIIVTNGWNADWQH